MSNYQRAASWIDRFACCLQRHDVDREEAIEIAAHAWNLEGEKVPPERAAEAIFATSGSLTNAEKTAGNGGLNSRRIG